MLHKNPFIIAPQTIELIKDFQGLPGFKDYMLVRGTSLALQLGHRNSIDIDLFTQNDFTAEEIGEILYDKFSYTTNLARKNTVLAVINNIRTDFIKHAYPFILPPIAEEGITFLSKEDITAMKFHAIIQSRKRLKDFIDIYYLLQHFCLQQMIEFFTQKYAYRNPMIALKAVNFFDDIDENIDPPKLLHPITLKQIKSRIKDATKNPSKIF